MIGGIEKPDSGSIIIEGLNITRLKNKNSFFARIQWGFFFRILHCLKIRQLKKI